MLTGFNTNIRHRGVLFHVQSEDSGRDHPHVITHLFHGGNIMASEKSSYAEHAQEADLEPFVRPLMEKQHKAVLKGLRAGKFDAVILERLGPDAFGEEPPADGLAPVRGEAETVEPVTAEPVTAAPVDAPPLEVDPLPEPGRGDATAARAQIVDDASPASEPVPQSGEDEESGRSFGEGIVSDKPLDEVILNYLVKNARKRKRPSSS